jgi:hypothetical protein
MAIPYKCLVARNSPTDSGVSDWVLFGASGSRLVVQSSKGAATIWPEKDAPNRVSGSMYFLKMCLQQHCFRSDACPWHR